MNLSSKKTTPNSPSFTDEKRGENSVKDMSVSLTKQDTDIVKKTLCDLCGNHHHFTDDGYQYIDCYWYQRSRDTKLGRRKEPQVEIWDKQNKVWIKK